MRKVKRAKELPEDHFSAPTLRGVKRTDLPPLPKPNPKRARPVQAEPGPLNPYEAARAENVARNRAMLEALGLA